MLLVLEQLFQFDMDAFAERRMMTPMYGPAVRSKKISTSWR